MEVRRSGGNARIKRAVRFEKGGGRERGKGATRTGLGTTDKRATVESSTGERRETNKRGAKARKEGRGRGSEEGRRGHH